MDHINLLKILSKKIDHLILVLGLEFSRDDKNKRAVFFDIDGTINRNDCLELLINEIVHLGLLSTDKTYIFEKRRRLWKSRECDFDEYGKVVIEMQHELKHFSREILEKLSFDIFEREGFFYLFPWLLLIRLKIMGYQLIAVSAAPSFMVKAYLEKIGFFIEKIHATEFIFEDNIFTGDVDQTIWKDKGSFIEKVYGKNFDLKKCIALGDTVGDAKMFEKIGHPIAINPTIDLAEKAAEKRWPVVIERKNLVLVFEDGQIPI